MKLILIIFITLFLTACETITGGRGLFENYYEVLEQDDFQMTIRAHCSRAGCPSIFSQANETAKAHCRSNNMKYTLAYSRDTGGAAGWEKMRYYKCIE
tara:strand:+ start:33 stop:326 length:294 start_codon:yes stop_codon:yes gene_type:complete